MKKGNKKGFALVEFLVVVAVIGILSVVGLIGYFCLTKRANVISESNLVAELNKVLESEHKDKKPSTMNEVVEELEARGFILSRLTPTEESTEIVYDMEKDRFFEVNADKKVVGGELNGKELTGNKWDHWKVVHSYSKLADADYSYYLGEMNEGEAEPAEGLSLVNGFDVGKNESKKIVFNNTNSTKTGVIIRTNGGSLEINAPNDSVRHYGTLNSLDIKAVANKSYHEYGSVIFAAIKTGHIAFEDNSSIQAVHVVANDEKKFDPIIISFKEEVEQPTYSRDEASIEPEGTKVCTLALPEETNNIILYRQGIYEQIKVQPTTIEIEQSETETSEEESVWVSDSEEATADTKSASNQLANELNGKRNDETGLIENKVVEVEEIEYTVVFNNETKEFEAYTNYVDEENKGTQVVVDETATKEEQAEVQALIDTVIEEVATETGKDSESKKDEVIAKVYVQAQVDPIDLSNNPVHFMLYGDFNKNYADEANLDTAYLFKGFTDEESEYMTKFINAVDEEGNNIFGIDNIDLDSLTEENINKALEYVNKTYGAETKDAIVKIIEQKSPYFNWLTDFEISFDKDIAQGSVALAGHYGAFADNFYNSDWLGFGLPSIKAGESVRLLQAMKETSSVGDFDMPYIAILAIVQQFSCGAVNLDNANVGTTMTVNLCIYNYDEAGNQIDRIVCGTYTYTFEQVTAANQAYLKLAA